MRDDLDDLLGIDTEDPLQMLATGLVAADDELRKRLVAIRVAKHLTQAQVGERMGVKQPAVAALERPDADPKLSTLRRYALALGVLVQHTVTDYPTPPTPRNSRTGARASRSS